MNELRFNEPIGLRFWTVLIIGNCCVLGTGTVIEIAQLYVRPLIGDATDVATYVIVFSVGFVATYLTLSGPDSAQYRPAYFHPALPYRMLHRKLQSQPRSKSTRWIPGLVCGAGALTTASV